MIQGLQLWRVRGQVDQLQPASMMSQQRGDVARLFGTVEVGIVCQDDRSTAPGSRSTHQRIAQGAEGEAIPPVGVTANDCAVAPVDGREEVPLAIGARGRDLGLMASPHPAAGQGGQQRQFSLILRIHIRARRGTYFERLGAGLFEVYWGSR